jgi:hypothetical protein
MSIFVLVAQVIGAPRENRGVSTKDEIVRVIRV